MTIEGQSIAGELTVEAVNSSLYGWRFNGIDCEDKKLTTMLLNMKASIGRRACC